MTDEVVTRLYGELVDALRRRAYPEDEPLTVAELHDEVIPYRSVRSRIGVELHADYEHALLRLLAGERGLLRVEPASARAELQREAAETYPDVEAFRRFLDSEVWVSLPAGPVAVEPTRGGEAREPDRAREPGARDDTPPEQAPIRLHRDDAVEEEASRDRRRPLAGRSCAFCTERLPERRRVRFCPYCGADQRLSPCPRCDAVLEQGWDYCIGCGYEMGE